MGELLPDVTEGRIEPGRVFPPGRARPGSRRLPRHERTRGAEGNGQTLRATIAVSALDHCERSARSWARTAICAHHAASEAHFPDRGDGKRPLNDGLSTDLEPRIWIR